MIQRKITRNLKAAIKDTPVILLLGAKQTGDLFAPVENSSSRPRRIFRFTLKNIQKHI
jgi:hypothetical protein